MITLLPYDIENMVSVNLTRKEMNVVRNGLTLILSMDQTGKLDLNESARRWYTNVLSLFETIYGDKWQ